jgi:hypothetical protein
MEKKLGIGLIIFSLMVSMSFGGPNPANWDSFEYSNFCQFGQWQGSGGPTYGTSAIGGVSIGINSADSIAHTGIKSLKVDTFTLGAYTTTYRRIGIFDKGDSSYWYHWCGGSNILYIWCYIPPANWIPGLRGENIFTITTNPYNIYGPPVSLNTGWNYISVDVSSVRNQYSIYDYRQQDSRWLGIRITNTNTTTAFSGPFYLDDFGSIAAPGIYYINSFDTEYNDGTIGGWGNLDAVFGSVPVALDTSSLYSYSGNWALSASFSLAADTTTTYKAGWFKTLNVSYNLMPFVGLRCYLYFPTAPPEGLYTQYFAQVGIDAYRWVYVDQPGMQAGWNELVIDLSHQQNYSMITSRVACQRDGVMVGQNTTVPVFDFTTTLYTDEVEAVPAIEATTTAVTWAYGSKDFAPYIQYGLPFGPLTAHYYLWESSNSTVAFIADSTSGVVQGLNPGTATITVKDRTEITASITANITIGTLVVSPLGPIELVGIGTSRQFIASGGVAPYFWSVSSPGVGSLDTTEGATVTLTAVGVGTVDLIVTDSTSPTPQQVSIPITVSVAPLLVGPPGPLQFSIGLNKQFTASGGTEPYIWTLSNSTVGYVSPTTGTAATFYATGVGLVDLMVTDSTPPTPQQTTVNITIIPTVAPLFIEADKPGLAVRMAELFE